MSWSLKCLCIHVAYSILAWLYYVSCSTHSHYYLLFIELIDHTITCINHCVCVCVRAHRIWPLFICYFWTCSINVVQWLHSIFNYYFNSIFIVYNILMRNHPRNSNWCLWLLFLPLSVPISIFLVARFSTWNAQHKTLITKKEALFFLLAELFLYKIEQRIECHANNKRN